jgi:hypothetical protein
MFVPNRCLAMNYSGFQASCHNIDNYSLCGHAIAQVVIFPGLTSASVQSQANAGEIFDGERDTREDILWVPRFLSLLLH